MSFFNGVVGVHIAIIMRRVPKPAKKETNKLALLSTYLPLVDRGEGYDEEKASQKIGSGGAGTFAGFLYEAIKQMSEAKVKKPTTVHVWMWVLLCGYY
jgi:hypothetical protein